MKSINFFTKKGICLWSIMGIFSSVSAPSSWVSLLQQTFSKQHNSTKFDILQQLFEPNKSEACSNIDEEISDANIKDSTCYEYKRNAYCPKINVTIILLLKAMDIFYSEGISFDYFEEHCSFFHDNKDWDIRIKDIDESYGQKYEYFAQNHQKYHMELKEALQNVLHYREYCFLVNNVFSFKKIQNSSDIFAAYFPLNYISLENIDQSWFHGRNKNIPLVRFIKKLYTADQDIVKSFDTQNLLDSVYDADYYAEDDSSDEEYYPQNYKYQRKRRNFIRATNGDLFQSYYKMQLKMFKHFFNLLAIINPGVCYNIHSPQVSQNIKISKEKFNLRIKEERYFLNIFHIVEYIKRARHLRQQNTENGHQLVPHGTNVEDLSFVNNLLKDLSGENMVEIFNHYSKSISLLCNIMSFLYCDGEKVGYIFHKNSPKKRFSSLLYLDFGLSYNHDLVNLLELDIMVRSEYIENFPKKDYQEFYEEFIKNVE